MRRQSNKDISGLLAISERTVKFHVSNILSKLQVSDRRASDGRVITCGRILQAGSFGDVGAAFSFAAPLECDSKAGTLTPEFQKLDTLGHSLVGFSRYC
jgi:hypothetical protein